MKLWRMGFPGRRMHRQRRGRRLLRRAKAPAAKNSTTRLISVAAAAPVTPMAGAPNLPKIST